MSGSTCSLKAAPTPPINNIHCLETLFIEQWFHIMALAAVSTAMTVKSTASVLVSKQSQGEPALHKVTDDWSSVNLLQPVEEGGEDVNGPFQRHINRTYICTYVCTYMHIRMYVCMCVCMYVCMYYMCVCVCVCVCACTYITK